MSASGRKQTFVNRLYANRANILGKKNPGKEALWPLTKIHQIGELVAAVAVILSLPFVGFEIQQNSRRQSQATTQTVVSDFSAPLRSFNRSRFDEQRLVGAGPRGYREPLLRLTIL